MKVKEWMTKDPITLDEEDIVKQAVMVVLRKQVRHLPVLAKGRLVGIVSDRDLKRALPSVAAGASPEEYQRFMNNTRIADIMVKDPLFCSPDTDVIDVLRLFFVEKIGALPVIDGGEVVGIVSQTDIMRAYLKDLESRA